MANVNLQRFDVVVVPFPFTDRHAAKRRPALVLSSRSFNQASQHSVLAMIASAEQSGWLAGWVTMPSLTWRPPGCRRSKWSG